MSFQIRGTTVLGVIKDGIAVIGADGQATLGKTIIKRSVKKVRKLQNEVLVGFAGSTADVMILLERFERIYEKSGKQLRRAAVAFGQSWRTDKFLRRLEAMVVVMNREEGYLLSGSGDVIEPDEPILAIGSGAPYAYAAARALYHHSSLTAEAIVKEALTIAADICIFTNHHFTILTLD